MNVNKSMLEVLAFFFDFVRVPHEKAEGVVLKKKNEEKVLRSSGNTTTSPWPTGDTYVSLDLVILMVEVCEQVCEIETSAWSEVAKKAKEGDTVRVLYQKGRYTGRLRAKLAA